MLLDGRLHFPSPEVFENYMFGLKEYEVIGEDSFLSLASVIGDFQSENLRLSEDQYSKTSDFRDTPLLSMLDKDGMLVIDDYIISLDFENQVAGVTKDKILIPLLRAKDFSHTGIKVYTFEEELLNILFGNEGISKYLNNEMGVDTGDNMRILECPGTPRPGLNLPYRPTPAAGVTNPREDRVTSFSLDTPPIGGYIYRINAKHAYQAAALYFRLKSELEHYRRTDDPTSIFSPDQDPFMSISYWGDFTPARRSKVFLDFCWEDCEGCWPQPANRQKVQKVHWEAGRRLTQVNLYGIYRGRRGGSHAGINALPYEFRLVPIIRS
jgi:hypothetical protein